MKIGITGTRRGASTAQLAALEAWFTDCRADELHHGDCRGVDEVVAKMARRHKVRIVSHPPNIGTSRAYVPSDVYFKVLPYIERNHVIVDMTDGLIVVPNSPAELIRSGTWATCRYARSKGKRIWIIYPDGTWEYEGDHET